MWTVLLKTNAGARVVELEEMYAKSSLIKHNDDVFGLIDLPSFYFDMQITKNVMLLPTSKRKSFD